MRDVAFSCDDRGVPFLKVAVWSLLSRYEGGEPIRVNVFEGWGGHSAAHKAEMEKIVGGFPRATPAIAKCQKAGNPVNNSFLLEPPPACVRPINWKTYRRQHP